MSPEAAGLENIPQGGIYDTGLKESDFSNLQFEEIENIPPSKEQYNSITLSNNCTGLTYKLVIL